MNQVKFLPAVMRIAGAARWFTLRMIERRKAGCPATPSDKLGDDRVLDHTEQMNNVGNPKHLIIPLLALVGILLAVLSALLHRAVVDQNAQAAADSVHLARAAFATTEQDLRVSVRDYSWW